jgi:hypothetical protein
MVKSKGHVPFKLDDGRVLTTADVSKILNCSQSTAYARLTKSTDPARVLRTLHKSPKGGRIYTLDDGSKWTARQVAKHTGVAKSTASTRLSMYTEPEKVLCSLKCQVVDVSDAKICETRMFFDPLGHWALINKAL